jgi:hypothetical protein
MNTISDNTTIADIGPSIDKVTAGAKAVAGQGWDMLDTAIQQGRDSIGEVSDNLMKYAKKNPGKAVLIGAASGALLATLVMALTRSRG